MFDWGTACAHEKEVIALKITITENSLIVLIFKCFPEILRLIIVGAILGISKKQTMISFNLFD
ncbi:MAG: hypothetical protein Q7U65_00960 [Bacteroidota bacterium]|nr:hypothetical protein [Bacteroidota bacterium]